jgi:hypothetical protein
MERPDGLIKLTRIFSRITWAPHEVELVEEQLDEDQHPIRLRDTNRSFTPKQYELARAILDNFPDIKPGIRKEESRLFRKQVRLAGIKYSTPDLNPALQAIFLNRLRDPLEP